jgi:hypothetical protein
MSIVIKSESHSWLILSVLLEYKIYLEAGGGGGSNGTKPPPPAGLEDFVDPSEALPGILMLNVWPSFREKSFFGPAGMCGESVASGGSLALRQRLV